MTTIAEVREKYPQYKDLSDEQLAKGLHGKFYSDMPYEQFAQKIGLKPVASTVKPETSTLPANAGLANFMATTLGLPVDTVANAINLAIAGGGVATGTTPGLIEKPVGGAEWLRDRLRQTRQPGLSPDNPNPQDPRAKEQFDMMARGGFIPGGALPAAGSIIAEKIGGPEWAGVGTMLPQTVVQAGRNIKASIADPATVQQNVQTAKTAGTRPDVAQATESNFLRGLTNVISRFPGGQGVITKFREKQQEQLGASARTGVSAERAGRAIKEGVTGEGGFLERTKATWLQLDDALAQKAGTTAVVPGNTMAALDTLTAPTAGAVKTTGALVNPTLAKMKENLAADMLANNGEIPFQALRSLRTKVGSMLDDSLVSGVPNGELKKVYGALSKDLEEAARRAGAGREFDRQSNYYKARIERVENTLDAVLGDKKTFEQIFKGVTPTDVDSVNKIRRVFRSLDEGQRQLVSEAVVNRLGRTSPGKQDVTGEKFSSDTFLTNWSRINDSAKAQLFPDSTMRAKVDAIAKVSSEIRDSKTPFANNSGTAQGLTAAGVYGSVPAAGAVAMSGNLPAAAMTLGVAGSMVVGANIGAKMLTSPKVVDWLAKAPKVTTPEQMTAHLGRLSLIYSQTKDEALRQELGEYISSVQ